MDRKWEERESSERPEEYLEYLKVVVKSREAYEQMGVTNKEWLRAAELINTLYPQGLLEAGILEYWTVLGFLVRLMRQAEARNGQISS